MYIDKIYTKLYSNKDWNGLNQLVNEIKSFSRRAYEGLTIGEITKLANKRKALADEIRKKRKDMNAPFWEKDLNYLNNKAVELRKNALIEHNENLAKKMVRKNPYDGSDQSIIDRLTDRDKKDYINLMTNQVKDSPEYIDPYIDAELDKRHHIPSLGAGRENDANINYYIDKSTWGK